MSMRTSTALLLCLFFSSAAWAHRFAPSLLKISEVSQHNYQVVWKTPLQVSSPIPLRPVWPDTCLVTSDDADRIEGTGRVSSWQMRCEGSADNPLLGKHFGIEGLAENQASALVMLDLQDGRHYQQVLNAEDNIFVVPASPRAVVVAKSYARLGVSHIWGGIDHLLFVLGLMLLVKGGRRLLWTITAFTLGHSITLSLVTLGFFTYPVALVEFAIALSIFLLAVELARDDNNDLLWQHPWWLAGGFGLLHGMGFAGALADTGLPQKSAPLALLFFNLGIEIGQVVFIAMLLAMWWLVRRPLAPWHKPLRWVPIYVLGCLSALWCIERGLEVLA